MLPHLSLKSCFAYPHAKEVIHLTQSALILSIMFVLAMIAMILFILSSKKDDKVMFWIGFTGILLDFVLGIIANIKNWI